MMAGYDVAKVDPADVVRAALDGIEAGKLEVLVDEWSADVKASLARDPFEFYGQPCRRDSRRRAKRVPPGQSRPRSRA